MEKTFTVGNIFSRSFDVFGKNFAYMLIIALLATLPTVLSELNAGNPSVQLLITPLAYLVGFMLEGVVAFGVFQHLTGQRMALGPSFAVALRRLGFLVLVSVITLLLIGFGMILLIVPGVIVSLVLWVAVPVTVVERGSVDHALRRSAELTKGNRGTIFGISFLMGLLTMVSAGIQFVTGRMTLSMGLIPGSLAAALAHWPVFILTTGLVAALSSVVVTVGYYALRSEVDGVATEDLAAVFE